MESKLDDYNGYVVVARRGPSEYGVLCNPQDEDGSLDIGPYRPKSRSEAALVAMVVKRDADVVMVIPVHQTHTEEMGYGLTVWSARDVETVEVWSLYASRSRCECGGVERECSTCDDVGYVTRQGIHP